MDAEAEAEYEDTERYLREGQEYEYKAERRQSIERLQALERREPEDNINLRQPQHNHQTSVEEVSEDEHSVFYHMQTRMAQVTEDKACITDLAKQI